jgi:hypothetical protein
VVEVMEDMLVPFRPRQCENGANDAQPESLRNQARFAAAAVQCIDSPSGNRQAPLQSRMRPVMWRAFSA